MARGSKKVKLLGYLLDLYLFRLEVPDGNEFFLWDKSIDHNLVWFLQRRSLFGMGYERHKARIAVERFKVVISVQL
jgi:hypothetical protein